MSCSLINNKVIYIYIHSIFSYDERIAPYIQFSYCIDCPSPRFEGSLSRGLLPKYNKVFASITAEVVYSVPNFADKSRILNKHEIADRIVMVDRGVNSILDKVINLQSHGARGIIVVDDGRCDDTFTSCGRGGGAVKDGGFSSNDDSHRWKSVHIPVILVSKTVANVLTGLMDVTLIDIPRLGLQKVSATTRREGREL